MDTPDRQRRNEGLVLIVVVAYPSDWEYGSFNEVLVRMVGVKIEGRIVILDIHAQQVLKLFCDSHPLSASCGVELLYQRKSRCFILRFNGQLITDHLRSTEA